MLYWVFDVDHTLYQLPNDAPFFSYSFLSPDPQLKYLLSTIPCKKLLFTNGTKDHGIMTVKKLNVRRVKDKVTTLSRMSNEKKAQWKIELDNHNSLLKDCIIIFPFEFSRRVPPGGDQDDGLPPGPSHF